VDIAGGFSDLPPIFYEHGGSVVGVAVAVDGVKPLSARCRRRQEGDGLRLVSEARSLEDGSLLYRYETHVTTLQDLMDYRDLNSGACLLKSSVLCLGIIPLSAIHGDVKTLKNPIQPYLDRFFGPSEDGYGGMIELVSTSLLPRGSGMGSSSLLSACVLSAICRCAGVKLVCTHRGSDTNSLSDEEIWTHTVLALEQIMHSGGGYQVRVIELFP
jgi:fucokinase